MTTAWVASAVAILLAPPGRAGQAPSAAQILAELPENTWVRLVAERDGPWKRNYCGMCFDSRAGRVLSWGGAHFSYPGNEIQAYAVGSDRWVALDERCVPPTAVRWWGGSTPGAVDPHGRPLAAHSYDDLVYDPVGNQLIWMRVGGSGVWLCDLKTLRWRLSLPAGRPPAALAACSAYVSDGRLVAVASPRSPDLHLYDIARNTFTAAAKLPQRPYNAGMTYDSANKLIVLAGGTLKDTWLYSIASKQWRKADRQGGPQGAGAVGVAFDSVNRVVLVVGAERAGPKAHRNRTWVLDAAGGKWTDPKPKAHPSIPLAGIYGSLVFDPARNVALVTWGPDWRGKCQTWAYRYRATGKEQAAPAAAPDPRPVKKTPPAPKRPAGKPLPAPPWVRVNPGEPPAAPWYRGLSGAVYCDKADRVFFFGASAGNSAGSQPYVELYDPAANSWEKVPPARQAPRPPLTLTFALLAYDRQRDRVLLPCVSGDPARSRTWAFDMAKRRWLDLKPPTQPRVVPLSAAVYDARNRLTVLFGGSFDGGPQTWLYEAAGNRWRNAAPKTSPSARVWHNMAFDEEAGVVVLFGGHDGQRDLGDTWLYDAAKNTWTDVTGPPARPSPGPRCGHAMAYDAHRGAAVLFGGHTTKHNDEADEEAYLYQKSHSDPGIAHGDTWAFAAAGRAWSRLAPEASPPPARKVSGAMAYDRRRGRLVLMHPWKPPHPRSRKYNTCQVWTLGSPAGKPAR